MNIEKIKKALEEKSEKKYREFSLRLINGSSLPLLGIRLPNLRRLAAENDGYYYKIGAAWCVATALVKYPEKTLNFLRVCRLDDFTYNKAIQKSVESHRISDGTKLKLKAMKRK